MAQRQVDVRGRSARQRAAVVTTLVVALLGACTPDGSTGGDPATDEGAPLADAAKPVVLLPEEAPEQLRVDDLVVGDGEVAASGDTVLVHLVAVAFSSGEELESTWELQAPRTIPLVEGGAIEGFLAGVAGMQVGGRRYLVVPPDRAYGQAGAPPDVAPGETLVFVVDLLGVSDARGT